MPRGVAEDEACTAPEHVHGRIEERGVAAGECLEHLGQWPEGEHGGKRFTMLWYSVATTWLKKLSDSDREELTQSGYSHSFCVAGSYMNDARSYENEF